MDIIFREIIKNNIGYVNNGNIASYIPELAKSDKNDLGVYLITLDAKEYFAGDYEKKFTMQSISKVLSLMLSLYDNGESKVFEKVGMEPTGDSFNSIVNLELKSIHKPFNPMINAGAIATSSLIKGSNAHKKIERILCLTKKLAHNPDIKINEDVFASEKLTGYRNHSLAYFMKSYNIIEGSVEDALDVYFKQCSIEVNCRDIANIGSVLANDGISIKTGERIMSKEICRTVKTIMSTCGLYDASGNLLCILEYLQNLE